MNDDTAQASDGISAESLRSQHGQTATPASRRLSGVDPLVWLAFSYPLLVACGYLFKKLPTDPAIFWPANAAALLAFLLVGFRRWALVAATLMVLDLVSILVGSQVFAGGGIEPVTALKLTLADALSVIVPAFFARYLHVAYADDHRQLTFAASPLWLFVFLIGGLPGAILGNQIYAVTEAATVTPVSVITWLASSILGIVSFVPMVASVLGLVREPAAGVEKGTERVAVLVIVVAIFGWRGFATWADLARVPSLTLLTVPMLWAALRFSHRATGILVAGVTTGVSLSVAQGFGYFAPLVAIPAWQDPILLAQFFMLMLFGPTIVINKMVLEARAHVAALRDERDRSVWYARALDAAEERARHRTARELHDGIAQALTGQRLLLASLRRELGSQAPHKLLDTLDHVTAESQSYVRDLIQDLNPPELDDSRLTVIVAKLSRQFLARYAFRVTFEVNGDDRIDPSDLPLVYRIVRELLFNALKHSQTDAADVKVAASEGEVLIAVVDHGVGFTAEAIGRRGRGSGFGLADLCERVRAVGGDVEIGALLPRGSRVSIRLPPSPFRQLSTVT